MVKRRISLHLRDLTSVDHLLVAGGGGGGGDMAGGGGAGGYLETKNTTISAGQKTIVVGGGGVGGYMNCLILIGVGMGRIHP